MCVHLCFLICLFVPILLCFPEQLSHLPYTGFIQILEKSGKSWNLKLEFSRSRKSWKMTLGMEKSGKVMENETADLEN